MDRLPISLCVIVKDDPLLEGCLRSVREHVKEIVVVRTAKDVGDLHSPRYAGLIDVLSYGDEFIDPEIEDFSFCRARNKTLELASQPWWMWLDSDDRMRQPDKLHMLFKLAEAVQQPGRQIFYELPYEYAYAGHPGQSDCITLLKRERLFQDPKRWHWLYPIHEVMVSKPGFVDQKYSSDFPVVEHHRTADSVGGKSERNLRIMKRFVEKHPDDLRCMYYYGAELLAANKNAEAVAVLARYIELGNWDDERALACLQLVNMHVNTGQYWQALPWALKTISIKENWQEGYFAMARVYYFLGMAGGIQEMRHWERCAFFAKMGLSLPETQTVLQNNPLEGKHFVYEWLNFALSKLGDYAGALKAAQDGLKARANGNLELNSWVYSGLLAKGRLISAAQELVSLRNKHGVVDGIVRDAFAEFSRGEYAQTVAGTTLPEAAQRTSGSRDIVIACGDGWEVWNPETAAKAGIGGSETAVIEMSKRLVKLGHRVRVYTSCGEAKVYDGVEYRPTTDMATGNTCDVLIAWRYAAYLDAFSAKEKWLWIHDVYAVGVTRENLAKADRILVLSEWHKRFVTEYHAQHGIDPAKVILTRNGIDLERFKQNAGVRDPHKVVWSSSPDRGLEQLLQMWPEIYRRVPTASLHIFYGFSNWEKSDPTSAHMARVKALIEANKSRAVHFHGRVDQVRLAREFLTAGAWLYPSWNDTGPFHESQCITRMESLAASLRITTSPVGALETSTGFEDYVRGDARTPEYQAEFIDKAVHCLTDQNPPSDRDARARYARENCSWDGVALQWNEWLGGGKAEEKLKVVDPEEQLAKYVKGEIAELPLYVGAQ